MWSWAVTSWACGSASQVGDAAISTEDFSIAADASALDATDAAPFVPAEASAVSVGGAFACGLTAGGGVRCWGYNSSGQLGDGTTQNRNTPVDVIGLSSGVVSIAAGGAHVCAVLASGALVCWGSNTAGQLGDGSLASRSAPANVFGMSSNVASVVTGNLHTCAISTTGVGTCWGQNVVGQLGDATTSYKTKPTPISSLGANLSAVSAAELHSCAVSATAGGAKCWGANDKGQLGDGTTTNTTYPLKYVVGFSSGAATISGTGSHSCILAKTGGLSCWGQNTYGQLGDGSMAERDAPVAVAGLGSGISSVSAGTGATCAIASGTVSCWGFNQFGQLGDGSHSDRTTPVTVSGLGTGVLSVSMGYYSACAITAMHQVRCWGSNSYGQLGDGSTVANAVSPVLVAAF